MKAVERIVGEHDTRLWCVLKALRRQGARRPGWFGGEQGRHRRDLGAAGSRLHLQRRDLQVPRVLFCTEGRDSSTVSAFAEDLRAHGGDPGSITDVCMDMSPAYYVGVSTNLPDAAITYDRYHLIQMLTKAVDDVRRSEAKSRPELRGTRYAWLKNPANLTRRQQGTFEWLTTRHLALQTARAYSWRLAFDEFFEQSAADAEQSLEHWYRGAIRSRLAPIVAFVRTIRTNWDGVVALASDPPLQRSVGGDQLVGAGGEAAGSRVSHEGEPHRDDLPHRRQAGNGVTHLKQRRAREGAIVRSLPPSLSADYNRSIQRGQDSHSFAIVSPRQFPVYPWPCSILSPWDSVSLSFMANIPL